MFQSIEKKIFYCKFCVLFAGLNCFILSGSQKKSYKVICASDVFWKEKKMTSILKTEENWQTVPLPFSTVNNVLKF